MKIDFFINVLVAQIYISNNFDIYQIILTLCQICVNPELTSKLLENRFSFVIGITANLY